jgi:hypothetical protein
VNVGYIYRTTCFPSGRVYIGKKSKPGFDPAYLGSGVVIRAAVRKHGRLAFTVDVLEFADSLVELNKAERRQIIEHRTLLGRGNVYNLSSGGDGFGVGRDNPCFGVHLVGAKNGHFGKHFSAETKKVLSARQIEANARREALGLPHHKVGTVWTPEMKAKLSASKKGQGARLGAVLSEETKRKIGDAHRRNHANGYRCAFTAETRRKISEGRKKYCAANPGKVGAKLGSKLSEEAKRKIGDQARRRHAAGEYAFLQSPEVIAKRIQGLRRQVRVKTKENANASW